MGKVKLEFDIYEDKEAMQKAMDVEQHEKEFKVMSKVILEFDPIDDADRLQDAMDGTINYIKLEDVWEKCFRPNRKYGYANKKINAILDNKALMYIDKDGEQCCLGSDLIELIAEIYLEIKNDED